MASLTLEEVQQHTSRDDLWIIHNGKVYEVTDFAGRHPGGADLLLERGAQEVGGVMGDHSNLHAHSEFAYQILNKFYIGELVDNNNETKGLHNVKANGIANGKANGISNGKANGISNGKANGISNGKANGISNGKANGISNGKSNGVIHRQNGRGTMRPPSETGGKTMFGWREEELVDWDKPLLGQVGKLGKDYLEWVHSPVDKHVRLFESEFLEYFADNHWWFIPVIWFPVSIFFLSLSYGHIAGDPDLVYMPWLLGGFLMTPFHIPLGFLLGLLCWTITEYGLHRWLFHLAPPVNSPFLITFHFLMHGQHHKAPFDKYRLVFPPAFTLVFVILFSSVGHKLLDPGLANSILGGMMFGYTCYDLTHYYLHHGVPFFSYFKGLKQYHIRHHFINQQKGFGISSKLWDYPFQTVLPVNEKRR